MNCRAAVRICRPFLSSAIFAVLLSFSGAVYGSGPACDRSDAKHYNVGVWFFTAWNSSNDEPWIDTGRKLYGRTDPWAGIQQHSKAQTEPIGQARGTGGPLEFTSRRPLFGFYDLADQAVVDREIDAAASEGISFFAFYWYLDGSTGRARGISSPIARFFESSHASRMKFLLSPLIGPGGSPMSLETWRSAVIPQILHYMKYGSYYRLDGRPVIIDYNNSFGDAQTWRAAYDALRERAKLELGVEPFVVALLPGKATYGNLLYHLRYEPADAYTCFDFPVAGKPEAYSALIARWIPAMLSQVTPRGEPSDRSVLYIPCATLGQDRRPWLNESDPSTLPFVTGVSPVLFERHLRELRNFIDAELVRTPGLIMVYAWNEWGEAAASLEPSLPLGYAYPDALRRVFELCPRAPRP